MGYPETANLPKIIDQISLYTQLQHEYGALDIAPLIAQAEKSLNEILLKIQAIPVDAQLAADEPNDLVAIKALRPDGPRRIWKSLDQKTFRDRLTGALLARFAGCTLGAPVEVWSMDRMEKLARENGEAFPPVNYWNHVHDPYDTRYEVPRVDYTLPVMTKGVPIDDDIVYTLVGLLTAEDFGHTFSIDDNGKSWLKYLPMACTAEDMALQNLKKGITGTTSAETNNPFCQWIGADIRSDPWGYIAAGNPEYAADMAYRDAYVSHRRNGIYGEMFFSAAIAAAFTVDHPIKAIEIGLTEIPKNCSLALAIRWALDIMPKIKSYRQAREAVDEHFAGMHCIQTINNACLTVFGLSIGGTDVTKVIGETVAMGLDNDCTAATAGSIVGAVVGKSGVPKQWYEPFKNSVFTYLIGHPEFAIDDIIERFVRQAQKAATEV